MQKTELDNVWGGGNVHGGSGRKLRNPTAGIQIWTPPFLSFKENLRALYGPALFQALEIQ